MKHKLSEAEIRKKLGLSKHITMLIGAVWVAFLMLFLNSISGFTGTNLVTGNLVADETTLAAEPGMPSIVSTAIYFLGMVVLGGAIFAVSKHSQELRQILKLEKQERTLVGSPKQALLDFFSILSTWSIKNLEPEAVLESLERIRGEEKKDLPVLKKVSFRLSKDDDLLVDVAGEQGWDEVRDVFEVYLACLDIDREKMLNIADYLGRNDLGTILCEMDEKKQDKEKRSIRSSGKATSSKDRKKTRTSTKPKKLTRTKANKKGSRTKKGK